MERLRAKLFCKAPKYSKHQSNELDDHLTENYRILDQQTSDSHSHHGHVYETCNLDRFYEFTMSLKVTFRKHFSTPGEKYYFMQSEIESTSGENEMNIGKLQKNSKIRIWLCNSVSCHTFNFPHKVIDSSNFNC